MPRQGWIITVIAAMAVAFGWFCGPVVYALATGPRLPAMVKPVLPDSELGRLMAAARKASREEDHKQAVALYTQALVLESGPNVIAQDLHELRGNAYNVLGENEKAFADFDAAIRIGYSEPLSDAAIRAYMGRGYAAVNLGRYRLAKDDFGIVLKAIPADVPRSSSTLAWRGAAHQGLGDRAHAVADYKASLALHPDNGYARQGLKDLE